VPNLVRHFLNLPTSRFFALAGAVAVVAGAFDILRWLAPYGASTLSSLAEVMGPGLFALAYALFAALVVIGPLRPHSHFSLSGNYGRRVVNLLAALGGLALLHFWIATGLTAARS